MQKVKASPFYFYKMYIIENYGEQRFEDVLGNAKEETKKIFKKPIVLNEWIDTGIYCDFLEAIDKTLGRKDYRAIAEYTVKKEIGIIFGLVLRFISLDYLIPKAQELWNKQYSQGIFEARREGSVVIFRISEFRYSNLQLRGIMYYLEAFMRILEKKKYIGSIKKIDESTAELVYVEN